jgi:hypothetical protein
MEKQPTVIENINYRERLALGKVLAEKSAWFQEQLVAAPISIKETFVPILSITSILLQNEQPPGQQTHLRRMVAIQTESLRTIPKDVGGVEELRQFIDSEYAAEIAEWRAIEASDRKPVVWKNAFKDVSKLRNIVSASLSS